VELIWVNRDARLEKHRHWRNAMKRAIILPTLVTAFVALSPVGVALATPDPAPTTPDPAPTLPVINVGNAGSGVFCNAGTCWIDRGECADSRPYSHTKMTQQCV
jgi:hypothetical protein